MDIRIRTNLYLITAILLTSNFLTLCEGDNDIDHEIFSDHLYDLDHLDDLHDINNFDDDKVIHRVELVQHNGDAMNNFASTSHTNKDTNNKLFTNTIPINQKSDVPTAFTKVVKQTVIKQSNNDGNNSPETNDLSMEDILYSNNKLKENGIGNMNNIILPPIPSQPASDLQGNIKNIIHTTVTKTTTSGSPSSKLNESFNRINNLDALSTMSSANSNYNAGIAGSTSSQSNSLDENSNRKTISTIENIIDGDGMSTSNNIASSMTNPLGYNTVTTATVDRDSEFNKGIPSRTQQTNLNKLNSLGNLGSETGALQNPNSIVQTKTTIIKNGRAADDFKLSDSNDKKIDYNVAADGMSTSNNIGNLNYDIKSSNNYDNDNGSGYSYSYSFGNGMNVGDYDNIGDIISSSHLMDGSSSGGYSTYMLLHSGYSKGNGKPKKIKKNGSTEQFKGRRSKNISYGKNKGNRQIRVKNGRNYKNTRSSKNRSGGDSQFNSSNSFTRGGKNRSSSSSSSFSDDSSMKNKESCHCNKGRKLNKRDSSESHESSHSKEHRGPEINYLGSSMDNHLMQNNGDFVARFPPPLPPSMEREPQSNLLFNRIQGQRPDQSLNLSQTTVLDRLEKTRSQLINDQQLPNIDVSNQYLTHQIPNTGSLFKSDSQQRQYLGPPDLGLGLGTEQGPGIHPGHDFGPQANPFDSKPYFVGDYPKYFENNLQSPSPPPPSPPPSQPTHPYSFNLDFYSDLSKMGSTIPELTDVQSGQGNQINIYNDLPQMQQDIEGSGLNRMEATNSRSMTTRTRSPIIQYFKTIKTTENIDGNDASDIRSVQTQSVPPKVYGTM
ncbi:PREDICTED: uncharacterized protein DDB_G0287625-like [Diuraphis noxia]|uniref:uncharacterized protein DDB_G0287625-like n=1 Tax=Diuraphis noxia TaxID=143948 RepID=UPI00076390DF|nr:PREDICTED: uncharacterized protein DDB_G0287625-like [Diuraphis noxia]